MFKGHEFYGFGGTVAFVMFGTKRNNITDIVEFKFGRRIDTMVATCDSLISKSAEALTVQLMGIVLTAAGFEATLATSQHRAALNTICALLGWVPAIVTLAMLLFAYKKRYC